MADMVTFDEAALLAQGARIYGHRDEIEAIAAALDGEGYSSILFCSAGGSEAMMDPFVQFVNGMSKVPVAGIGAADLVLTGWNQIDEKTVCFMSSKSGDTGDTLKAAQWLKERGVRIVSVNSAGDSPLQKMSDHCFVYGEGRPQELVFYLLIGKMMELAGCFDGYAAFADDLANLPAALVAVRKQFDARAIEYCERYHDAPYHIWVSSGDLWPVCYAYAMCVLEESQWIRTKSVASADFFHGTLELLDKDVPLTLLVGEGPTRPLDERVRRFAEQVTDELTVIDAADFELPGIAPEWRRYLGPVVMNAALQRISKNMEHVTGHSLDIRRYYRKVEY